ncbi:hypothetical protein AOLI_G00188920 [Acnodon oligacanthus]
MQEQPVQTELRRLLLALIWGDDVLLVGVEKARGGHKLLCFIDPEGKLAASSRHTTLYHIRVQSWAGGLPTSPAGVLTAWVTCI